jgi:hypothetical protein
VICDSSAAGVSRRVTGLSARFTPEDSRLTRERRVVLNQGAEDGGLLAGLKTDAEGVWAATVDLGGGNIFLAQCAILSRVPRHLHEIGDGGTRQRFQSGLRGAGDSDGAEEHVRRYVLGTVYSGALAGRSAKRGRRVLWGGEGGGIQPSRNPE